MKSMAGLIKLGIGAFIALVLGLFVTPKMFEILDAGEIMVIQYPNGKLEAMTEPGFYNQWFGSVTKYPRREQYSFAIAGQNNDNQVDQSLRISFNDGGSAMISGVVSWEMPKVPDMILKIHKEFHSTAGIDQQLIRPALENALFFSGPLMSSTESSAERRAELLQFINDQLQNGIYLTQRKTKQVTDPITGQAKEIVAGDIVTDEKGLVRRVADSPLTSFGIKMFPATVNRIKYDDVVQNQINERQKQITEVQTAIAQAKKAEQKAITVTKEGEASAAEAKWKQEVIKATEVTRAEQEMKVAELNVKTAEAKKTAARLEGEGEGARRAAIMTADGGLDKKLAAYVEVSKAYADAMKNGKMVPDISMGGGTPNGATNASSMIDLLSIKAAKDLSLDMSLHGSTSGKK
jgi:regulator of protease activity HflC (stomatin/prohibitin superfamily)